MAELEVWEEHLPAVAAWTVVSKQWRTIAIGGGLGPGRVRWVGLDAAGARAALEMAGVTLAPGDWGRLETIAAGAAEELNAG